MNALIRPLLRPPKLRDPVTKLGAVDDSLALPHPPKPLRVGRRKGVDTALAKTIQRVDLPGVTGVMRAATTIGGDPWTVVMTLTTSAAIAARGYRRDAVYVLFTLLLRLPNVLLKRVAGRARPTAEDVRVIATLKDLAFPSGHSGGALIFFGFVAYLAQIRIGLTWVRRAIVGASGLATALIGLSRIYLGAHWPSGLLGGYLYGIAMLGLLVRVHHLSIRRWPVRLAPGD